MPVPRDQFSCRSAVAFRIMQLPDAIGVTNLDRTENPKDEGLHNYEPGASDAECKVHSDILANVGV